MFQGGVPVKITVRFALLPLQIVVSPLRVAVGMGLTVKVAVPVRSAGLEVQLTSCKAAIE